MYTYRRRFKLFISSGSKALICLAQTLNEFQIGLFNLAVNGHPAYRTKLILDVLPCEIVSDLLTHAERVMSFVFIVSTLLKFKEAAVNCLFAIITLRKFVQKELKLYRGG